VHLLMMEVECVSASSPPSAPTASRILSLPHLPSLLVSLSGGGGNPSAACQRRRRATLQTCRCPPQGAWLRRTPASCCVHASGQLEEVVNESRRRW